MWIYNGKDISNISDFPENTYGFVYKLTHIPSGKSYIGRKNLIHQRKAKLTKKDLAMYEGQSGRKPKHKVIRKESDWKDYYGSNKIIAELLEKEPKENFKREILDLAFNKKILTYLETKYLFIYQVLEKPEEFFNNNILGKFYTIDFDS